MNLRGPAIRLLSVCLIVTSLYACSQPVSKEDYISDVNQLCAEAREDLDAFEEALREATSVEEVRSAVTEGRTAFERFHTEVAALEKPEEDRRTLDSWLSELDDVEGLMRRLEEATASGDLAEIEQVTQEAEIAQAEGDRLAMDYGIEGCAR